MTEFNRNAEGEKILVHPSIYFAGPSVFYKDAEDFFDTIRSFCKGRYTPLLPFDVEVDEKLSKHHKAQLIYQQNIAKIKNCDCVVADVSDFRGQDADSGTSWEIGYAVALEKPVFLYSKQSPWTLRDRILHTADGRDKKGMLVEDFDLSVNLMLAISSYSTISHNVFDAIGRAIDYMDQRHKTTMKKLIG